jgi:DDE domain
MVARDGMEPPTAAFSGPPSNLAKRYLNNLIEQDHRGIKSRTRFTLGFKNFNCAAVTIAGVEVLPRILKSQAVAVYGSKAKLHPRSGIQFLLHLARASRVHTPAMKEFAREPYFHCHNWTNVPCGSNM